MPKTLKILIIILSIFLGFFGYSQNLNTLIENKGQWDQRIIYHKYLPDGSLYFEKNKFTYFVYEKLYAHNHGNNDHEHHHKSDIVDAHAFQLIFENANSNCEILHSKPSDFYYNYFIGNDKSKWASKVRLYESIEYNNLYDGINLKVYETLSGLKYDYIIAPEKNPNQIQVKIEGIKAKISEKGDLVFNTKIGEITELAPIAYQEINNEKIYIPVKFKLNNNTLSFIFPEGYNTSFELVIDPQLVFSSYSGSTANNFGTTATYDDQGNLYAGGVVFVGGTYPTTVGAYQTSFTGLSGSELGITKFNSNGTTLDYSTYIGGAASSEEPHSLIVHNDELLIFGTTGSSDYPTTAGAYDRTFNGGTIFSPSGLGITYQNGCDIFITKLNSTGTAINASTFIGGTSNDGINTSNFLKVNYGDELRGEIIVDNNGNPIIATTTSSTNFPILNAAQNTHGGGNTDAIIFKLSNNLSTLMWSSFYGGSGDDAAYSTQFDSQGNIYFTGGTTSTNLTTSSNALRTAPLGGVDAFLVRLPSTGNSITAATYLGTTAYDQSYFVQVDLFDSIYIYGQTRGSYPVSANIYSNPNSTQFIHKLDNMLSSTSFSTVFGTGRSGILDISPTAFLVNKCGSIYISGWGGTTNGGGSSTTGLPISTSAFQATTDGSDFYLAVFSPNCQTLDYATFFGGATSAEHVDGGTSRFDKEGNVYQAVCAGCFGNSDFPTTVGAWSQTNNSLGCSLGVFKFNLDSLKSTASAPLPFICLPDSVSFQNSSQGGNAYKWYFGDGDSSSLFEPKHLYPDTGTYSVTLIVYDSTGCRLPDTSVISIDVFRPKFVSILPIDTICPGDSVQLIAIGGESYRWINTSFITDPNIDSPYVFPPTTTIYQVEATNSCNVDTAEIEVHLHQTLTNTLDTNICRNDSLMLNGFGGIQYAWQNTGEYLSNNSIPNPYVRPFNSHAYLLNVTDFNNCIRTDTFNITVDTIEPTPMIPSDTVMCFGDTIQVAISGSDTYLWSPNQFIDDITSNNPRIYSPLNQTYIVDFTNSCGTRTDSIEVFVNRVHASVNPNQIVCEGDTVDLFASGGENYQWNNSQYIVSTPIDSSEIRVLVPQPTTFIVTVLDSINCFDTAHTSIDFFPKTPFDVMPDFILPWGNSRQITSTGGPGTVIWSPKIDLTCNNCMNTVTSTRETRRYYATLTDTNGCSITDSILVSVDGIIYIPNSFTPNGDGKNDVFRVRGAEIINFEMWIYDRWGQLIFYSNDIKNGWDGKYKGNKAPVDAYVWKIKWGDIVESNRNLIGHVSLVR